MSIAWAWLRVDRFVGVDNMILHALDLSDQVGSNNYFLTLGGVDANSQRRVVRGGSIEIVPCPFVTDAGGTVTGYAARKS